MAATTTATSTSTTATSATTMTATSATSTAATMTAMTITTITTTAVGSGLEVGHATLCLAGTRRTGLGGLEGEEERNQVTVVVR